MRIPGAADRSAEPPEKCCQRFPLSKGEEIHATAAERPGQLGRASPGRGGVSFLGSFVRPRRSCGATASSHGIPCRPEGSYALWTSRVATSTFARRAEFGQQFWDGVRASWAKVRGLARRRLRASPRVDIVASCHRVSLGSALTPASSPSPQNRRTRAHPPFSLPTCDDDRPLQKVDGGLRKWSGCYGLGSHPANLPPPAALERPRGASKCGTNGLISLLLLPLHPLGCSTY